MKHSYHAHHAPPIGGPGSFLLGLNGAPGGFVAAATSGGEQDVFVGYRYAGEPWTLLPFVRESTAQAAAGAVAVLPHGRYGRTLGWATDRWMAQALVLLLVTPFAAGATSEADAEGDASLRHPAVCGLLDFDNAHMTVPAELVFAIGDARAGWHVARETSGPTALAGWIDAARAIGFGTTATDAVSVFDGSGVLGAPARGLRFHIPAGGKAVFPLALGWGAALEETLAAALGHLPQARALGQERDDELRATGLSDEARRTISLATRELLAAGSRTTVDLSLAALRARVGV